MNATYSQNRHVQDEIAKYKTGVAVFAVTKGGLVAEASLGGQKFGFTPLGGKT